MERITAESLRASNAAFKLPNVPHLADRIAEMRAIADTGIEHAMVVDWHSGAVLWRTKGNEKHVDLSSAYAQGLTQGNLTIHTHPCACECSIDDAAATSYCGARAGIAVCGDGTISIVGELTVAPFIYHLLLGDVVTNARRAYGIDMDKWRANDPVEIARDNRVIREAVEAQGWCSMWMTHYSDALMAVLPQTNQGE